MTLKPRPETLAELRAVIIKYGTEATRRAVEELEGSGDMRFDPDEERGSPRDNIEEATGAPAQVYVDGDAANEVLKLREENARLSQELVRAISEIQRERRERDFSEKAIQDIAETFGLHGLEHPMAIACEVAETYQDMNADDAWMRGEIERLQAEIQEKSLGALPGTPGGPPLVTGCKVNGDVMELSAPGMRAYCEYRGPGESLVQMRRTDSGELIENVAVYPVNDENLADATMRVVSVIYFEWWSSEARKGRLHLATKPLVETT